MVRAASRASIAIFAALAVGCGVARGIKRDPSAGSHPRLDAVATRPARAKADGPEHRLGIQWEPSLEAAMERGRREKKPVLVAFSARRQDCDFTAEF